jgi:two-component system osmolarity sensor histidine kinase EnvZ
MVATGLLMTLVAFVFLRNQLRPIRRLAATAEAFGQGQVTAYRPSGATEVRAAGRAFLDMRDRIERQREQRTLMLSGVSHDLRTPLTRLKLGLSMLPEDDDTRAMLRDVNDMQLLTDAFLAYARGVEASEVPEPVDPASLAASIVEDFHRTGDAVTAGPMAQGGSIVLRPHAMRRALGNLVGNALRYGRCARVSVLHDQSHVIFRVEDDGPGIPADKRTEALKPFTRLDTARNQDRGSAAGLGLAIAADIARAHGGSIRLTDSMELGGLCAEIEVPMHQRPYELGTGPGKPGE